MQNIAINMFEKFHYDRLRIDRALGNGKSDNNKHNKKNNVSGSKNCYFRSLALAYIQTVDKMVRFLSTKWNMDWSGEYQTAPVERIDMPSCSLTSLLEMRT